MAGNPNIYYCFYYLQGFIEVLNITRNVFKKDKRRWIKKKKK